MDIVSVGNIDSTRMLGSQSFIDINIYGLRVKNDKVLSILNFFKSDPVICIFSSLVLNGNFPDILYMSNLGYLKTFMTIHLFAQLGDLLINKSFYCLIFFMERQPFEFIRSLEIVSY